MDCLGTIQAVFCTSHSFPSLLTGLLTGNLRFAYSVVTTTVKTEEREVKVSSLDPLADAGKYRSCITVLCNYASPPEQCITGNPAYLRKLVTDRGCFLIFLHSLHKTNVFQINLFLNIIKQKREVEILCHTGVNIFP